MHAPVIKLPTIRIIVLTQILNVLYKFSGERQEDDGGLFRGHLYRKHVWESIDKAAANRAWVKQYFVVKPGQLIAYKDQKQAKQDKQAESPVNLAGASVEEAKDYKKKHCFRLKLVDGSEYIFKSKDDTEMNLWLDSLRAASSELESSTMSQSSRAQTLPASSSSGQEKKKGGFFTLKRK